MNIHMMKAAYKRLVEIRINKTSFEESRRVWKGTGFIKYKNRLTTKEDREAFLEKIVEITTTYSRKYPISGLKIIPTTTKFKFNEQQRKIR